MVTLAGKKETFHARSLIIITQTASAAPRRTRACLYIIIARLTVDAHSTGHVGVSSKIEIGYFCRYTDSVGRLMTCEGEKVVRVPVVV